MTDNTAVQVAAGAETIARLIKTLQATIEGARPIAGDLSGAGALAPYAQQINALGAHIADLQTVAANVPGVIDAAQIVGPIKDKIDALGAITTEITGVAGAADDVRSVSASLAEIRSVVISLADILAAKERADRAAAAETNAGAAASSAAQDAAAVAQVKTEVVDASLETKAARDEVNAKLPATINGVIADTESPQAHKNKTISAKDNDLRRTDDTPDLKVKTFAALVELKPNKVAVGDVIEVPGLGVYERPDDATDAHIALPYLNLRGKPIDGFYHSKQFGAKHTGKVDDSPAARTMFAAAEEIASVGTIGVFFDEGISAWETPVVMEKSGVYIPIKGAHRKSSIIRAVGDMGGEPMLRLGQYDHLRDSGTQTLIFSRLAVENIGFDLSHMATAALDMTYCRYSEVSRCGFVNPAPGGRIVSLGRWCNRFLYNEFSGKGLDGNPVKSIPLYIPVETINNFLHIGNTYSIFGSPITCEAIPNSFYSQGNSYDLMPAAAIAFLAGGRHIVLKNEDFERRGTVDADGIEIAAKAGGVAKYSAPIIVARNGSSATTMAENVIIEESQFKNCPSKSWAIFSGLSGLSWQKNSNLTSYQNDHAVRIVEYAIGASIGRQGRILIDQQNLYNWETELKGITKGAVGLEGANPQFDHAGMEIIERHGDSKVLGAVAPLYELIPKDLMHPAYTRFSGTVTKVGHYEGRDDIYELSADAELRLDITPQARSQWPGRYIRIGYMTKGVSASNGLLLDLFVDTGSGLSLVVSSSTHNLDWTVGGREMTLRIPEEAIAIRFRLRPIYRGASGHPAQVTQLHIDSAAAPLRL